MWKNMVKPDMPHMAV